MSDGFEAKGEKWGAVAALEDAINLANDNDGVLILIHNKKTGVNTFRAANLTAAESVYLVEAKKFDMFFRYYEETEQGCDDE